MGLESEIRSGLKRLTSGKVKLESLAPFYKRLVTLFGASIPIADALESQMQTGEETLDGVVQNLHDDVVRGCSLSGAMSRHSEVFSPLAVGLVRAGEESGHLDYVIAKLSDVSEQALRLKRTVISALTYPAVLCVTILGLAVLFATVICSQDESLFGSGKEALPWPTQLLVDVAAILTSPVIVGLTLLSLFAVAALWRAKLRSDPGFRLKFHKFLLYVPVVGHIIKTLSGARIVYVLGLCLDVGIGVMPALAMTERICWNQAIAQKVRRIRTDVGEGEGMGESMGRQSLFPPIVVSMTEVGEQTGELAEILTRVSETLEMEVNDALTTLAQTIEPILLVGSGGIAAFVAFAALAPMLQLLQSL